MNCVNHPEKQSVYTCQNCGKHLCQDCAINYNGRPICSECIQNINNQPNNFNNMNSTGNVPRQPRQPNRFLAFLFSLVPGAGHMYLGLMKRGLQLMLIFAIFIGVLSLFNIGEFQLLVFVIWFYSFFDCLHVAKKISLNVDFDDTEIFDTTSLKEKFSTVNKYYFAAALISIGSMFLIKQICSALDLYALGRFIEKLFLPLVLITCGVVILIRLRKKDESYDDLDKFDDINDFSDFDVPANMDQINTDSKDDITK